MFIPTDSELLLETGVRLLTDFSRHTSARGRFIALYLGLRRMGDHIAPIGSEHRTSATELQAYLDNMWSKRHRKGERVVLTAPFGGSFGAGEGYSARTGVVAAGLTSAANTWRNNFGVQKGVGCAAPADVFETISKFPDGRSRCKFMEHIPKEDGTTQLRCGITKTNYRGEAHAIWLNVDDDGYQVLSPISGNSYQDYLFPSGQRIPLYPLLAVLYSLTFAGFYPKRSVVGLVDFAEDFGFSISEVNELFDCEPTSSANAILLSTQVGTGIGAVDFTPAAEVQLDYSLPEYRGDVLLNSGLQAELAVAHELIDGGWLVEYVGNQRGLGFDLKATRENDILRIEVKSSTGYVTPSLTESEWQSAQNFGADFVLALVDRVGSGGQAISYVRDPAGMIDPSVRNTAIYTLPRRWLDDVSTEADFL